jgi:hypothetical protein
LSILLIEVLRRAGLKPAPQSKLPHLATYLGHKDITSTLVYLNITPELLHEASERFRKNGAAILQTGGSL